MNAPKDIGKALLYLGYLLFLLALLPVIFRVVAWWFETVMSW